MRLLIKLRSLCVGKQYRAFNKPKQSLFHNFPPTKGRNYTGRIIIGTSLTLFITYKSYIYSKNVVYAKEKPVNVGELRKDLPFFTLEEISNHTTKENRIWVTYKEGVYDITDFITGHPGGEQILMAAGSSVEPFWMLYAVHNTPQVYAILESHRIGNLKEDQNLVSDMSDPYENDPKRHQILKPTSAKPFNAEVPLGLLVESFITPNELFYVRNHLPVPEIDAETYQLELEVEGSEKSFAFTLEDLKKMPKHTITATIMCAGNRRSEMHATKPVKGLSWGGAAVGNARFSGVRLSDLLKSCGIDDQKADCYRHVQFEGIDCDATGKNYGASIPFWKAIEKRCDVLIAYEMNGVPIPRDHGFPVRVIVPGVVGARNVKWLSKIVLSQQESDSHWQQNDYKGFGPGEDWDTAHFTKARAIQELPVISAICRPIEGATVALEPDGSLLVKGYAWSGGGQKIIRVDVTADSGDSWFVANLDVQDKAEPPQHWSWTFWSVRIPVQGNIENVEIWAKAVDSCYNTQPESFKNIWNFRGVLSNAYSRVSVKIAR